ncbi:hypothetical protein BGZ79_000576, partial [Entomortierella chlamydospora]
RFQYLHPTRKETVSMRSEQDSDASIGHEYQNRSYNRGDCVFDEFGLCGRHEHGSDLCNPMLNHNGWNVQGDTRLESPRQRDRINDGDSNGIHSHPESENENGYKDPDRSWVEDYFAIHAAYKDRMASLHFNLCSDLHQRLLEHRHTIRRLQGQVHLEIGQLEPLLSDVVHDRVAPKMIYDLEAQRFCCREVGKVLRNELNDSLMLLDSKADEFEELRKSTFEYNEKNEDSNRSQTGCDGVSNEANGGVDENWTLFGWSATEKPFATWKEAFLARRQIRNLHEDTADSFVEGGDGKADNDLDQKTDKEDPYKKLGCFHSNAPIHGYNSNDTRAHKGNDHETREDPAAPKEDAHPNSVDSSSSPTSWSLPRVSKIYSASYSSLKRTNKITRVTDGETECERERYSTTVSSRPRKLAAGGGRGGAYVALNDVQNFYHGGVHYHYDAVLPPPPSPRMRERATRRDCDDDSGEDGSGDLNENHSVIEGIRGSRERPQSHRSNSINAADGGLKAKTKMNKRPRTTHATAKAVAPTMIKGPV